MYVSQEKYLKSCNGTHQGTCFILPSPILEQVIKEGKPGQRDKALYTYGLSKRMRGFRRALSLTRANLFASGSLEKHRIIYDMDHVEDEMLLPGRKVRDENGPNTGDKEATNAFRNTGATFDFYKKIYKRNSLDDKGAILISSVNYGTDFDNAFWNNKQMVFGNGGGGLFKRGTLTSSLSVVAHELTHGVTSNTADLYYDGESGGLNEAYSDIFGIMCEQWLKKQKVTDSKWLIGEGIFERGAALRDMKGEKKANPWDQSIYSYKDYAYGIDVHFSSGIANKAFYLTAKAIGGYSWEKAGKIWYIVLTQGWLSKIGPKIGGKLGRSFQEAANGTFTVAGQLYGEDSKEQNAVADGWKGVDITPTKDDKPTISEAMPFMELAKMHK
jgi:Zn-dependent metalloprotease